MTNTNITSKQLADAISRLFNNCQMKETIHASKYGVSLVEFRCLRTLSENGNLTVNQLAQKMSLTSSRITRIIDSLVSKKLVQRVSGENDRRIFYLLLTLKGKELANKMITNYMKMHDEILNNISEDMQQSMLNSLEYLNSAVEKWLEDK